MDTRFSSCRWKCELCYAEACQLSVPYDSLQQKPPLRTANSFMNDFLNAKSNGVIRKPNFQYWPTDRIAPYVMHCLNGPFNTICGKTVQRFVKLIEKEEIKQFIHCFARTYESNLHRNTRTARSIEGRCLAQTGPSSWGKQSTSQAAQCEAGGQLAQSEQKLVWHKLN